MRIDPVVQQWHIVYPVPIYQMLSITYRDRSAGSSPSPLVDPYFNPNLTGMFWLLNSTGMRVLCSTLFCAAYFATQDGDAGAISRTFYGHVYSVNLKFFYKYFFKVV